eukprot:429718-Pelagomonas_calceolata.AAC.5
MACIDLVVVAHSHEQGTSTMKTICHNCADVIMLPSLPESRRPRILCHAQLVTSNLQTMIHKFDKQQLASCIPERRLLSIYFGMVWHTRLCTLHMVQGRSCGLMCWARS